MCILKEKPIIKHWYWNNFSGAEKEVVDYESKKSSYSQQLFVNVKYELN